MTEPSASDAAIAAFNPALAALGRGGRRRLLFKAALRVVATTVLLLVVYFAVPVGGLYSTVTVFTTVGFGDIVARTDSARAVVTVQMLLDLVILGGLVRVVVGASPLGLVRRRSRENQPPEGQTGV